MFKTIEETLIVLKVRLNELESKLEDTDKWDDSFDYGYYYGMVEAYKEAIAMLKKEDDEKLV